MNAINDVVLGAWVRVSTEVNRRLGGHEVPTHSPEESDEEGSTTVEYAIGAIATAAFAGLLLAVLKSGGVKAMLTNIIQTALSV